MTLSEAILSVLLSLPGPWERAATAEPPEARALRLATIAAAIAEVSEETTPGWRWGARKKASALIATADDEGIRFHRAVHSGEKRGDCKAGRPCLAACLTQVHAQPPLITHEEWQASMGTDLESTIVCMRLGARVLAASARCVGSGQDLDTYEFSKLVTMYATGARCRPPLKLARARARRWQAIDVELEELLHPPREAMAVLSALAHSAAADHVYE